MLNSPLGMGHLFVFRALFNIFSESTMDSGAAAAASGVRKRAGSTGNLKSGSLAGTQIASFLTLVLYLGIIGSAAYAIIRSEDVARYNAVQDRHLLVLSDQQARDVSDLQAADSSNLALVEGEILALVDRVESCCNGSSYDDSFVLANLTAVWNQFYHARDSFRQNFTNFYMMVDMLINQHAGGDLKYLNGVGVDGNNTLYLTGGGCTTVHRSLTDPNTLLINTTCPMGGTPPPSPIQSRSEHHHRHPPHLDEAVIMEKISAKFNETIASLQTNVALLSQRIVILEGQVASLTGTVPVNTRK